MDDASGMTASLTPTILLLCGGTCALVVARRMRLSPIVGYLVFGFVLAVSRPQYVIEGPTVRLLSDLGVVFLLFDVGLHFSLRQIRTEVGDIFGFGPVQMVAGTAGIATAGWLIGLSASAAILVGAVLALSSTAVVAALLAERNQQGCPVGRTATAILVFQDVAAIALLVAVNALDDGGAVWPTIGSAFLKAGAAFAVAVVVARLAIKPFFSLLARYGGEEAFTPAALLLTLAAGNATAAIGLSPTLGAFLGGMAVAETPFRVKVRSEINPFRGLLLGFFFVSVGLSIDASVLFGSWPLVLAVTIGIMTIKAITNALASLVFQWSVPGSMQLGFLIAQGSELAFVLLSLPGMRRVVGQANVSILLVAVALSLAATSPFATLGRYLAGRGRSISKQPQDELTSGDPAPPILIVGMGETGRTLADALTAFGISYDAVEKDPRALGQALAEGYDVAFGDPTDPALWQTVYCPGRRYSILTSPILEDARDLTPIASTFYPAVQRVAVVDDAAAAATFAAAGISTMRSGENPKGVELARALLVEMGVDEGEADHWVHGAREDFAAGGRRSRQGASIGRRPIRPRRATFGQEGAGAIDQAKLDEWRKQ